MRTSRTQSSCKAGRNPISKTLSGLTIGSLTLSPTFSSSVTEYTTSTTNASNKVTATPTSADATVEITVNDVELENGASATWEEDTNEVEIKVTGDDGSTTYTVTVTAS